MNVSRFSLSLMLLMPLLHAAAGEYASPFILLKTIKNGKRERSILGPNGCHNSLSGVLFGCYNSVTQQYDAIKSLRILPPIDGGDGPEEEVFWPIPKEGSVADFLSQMRTNFSLFTLTHSDTHVLLKEEIHGEVKTRQLYEIPKTVATINLLLEVSTKGDYVLSLMKEGKSPSATMVMSSPTPSAPPASPMTPHIAPPPYPAPSMPGAVQVMFQGGQASHQPHSTGEQSKKKSDW